MRRVHRRRGEARERAHAERAGGEGRRRRGGFASPIVGPGGRPDGSRRFIISRRRRLRRARHVIRGAPVRERRPSRGQTTRPMARSPPPHRRGQDRPTDHRARRHAAAGRARLVSVLRRRRRRRFGARVPPRRGPRVGRAPAVRGRRRAGHVRALRAGASQRDAHRRRGTRTALSSRE